MRKAPKEQIEELRKRLEQPVDRSADTKGQVEPIQNPPLVLLS